MNIIVGNSQRVSNVVYDPNSVLTKGYQGTNVIEVFGSDYKDKKGSIKIKEARMVLKSKAK